MSTFPHLPLFTDAFIADTGHLNAQETGAYLMLLMVAWRSPECRLPDNDDKLARWARVDRRTWIRIKPTVMEFWTLAEGIWTQKRLSKERDIVSKRADVARRNGEQGGRPKSLENNEAANPAGSPRVTQKKAPIPIPIPKEEEEHTEATPLCVAHTRDEAPAGAFDQFWDRFPNKVGKQAAKASFDRVRKSGKVTFAELMAGLDRYIAAKPVNREWCNPTTFLNQGRWADQPAPPPTPFPGGNGHRQSPRPSNHVALKRAADLVGIFDDRDDAQTRSDDRGPVIDHAGHGQANRGVFEPTGGYAGRPETPDYVRLVRAFGR